MTNGRSRSQSNRMALLAVGALVAVSLAVLAIVALTGGDDDASGVETASVEVSGDPLPRLSPTEPGIGLTVPSISTTTATGTSIDLQPSGTARLIGVVAHWCPHCQRELPRTVDWLENNELPDGVELVLLSSAVEKGADNYPPSAWFDREGWTGTTALDDTDGTAAAALGLSGFPFWVAVDADGVVVQRASGELSPAQFEALLGMLR